MNTAVTVQQAQALEQVLIGGDLSKLNPNERILYYKQVCDSVGLNPITKPFEYINLNGKLTLYALRSCTEQLRKIHGVSIIVASREVVEGCYVVTARATDAKGRHDESIGAVPIDGVKGEARSNAMMKAETKAKRRVTLSICGLGMLDESEADSIVGASYPAPGGGRVLAEALTSIPESQRDVVIETATQVKAMMANDQVGDAYALWQDSKFDTDMELAFWSQLDSNTRATLKKMQQSERAQDAGTISPAKHKRLEALIKELKLDRNGLKDWCLAHFEVDSFPKLNDEQYRLLDEHIASIAPTTAPQNSTADVSTAPSQEGVGQRVSAEAVALISDVELQAIMLAIETKGIAKGRLMTKLAASGIKDVTQIPASMAGKIKAWVTEQR